MYSGNGEQEEESSVKLSDEIKDRKGRKRGYEEKNCVVKRW